MLLLSVSLALPIQIAKAQDKKASNIDAKQLDKAKKIYIKQVNYQETKCKSGGHCPATAVNMVCLKGAVCYVGYGYDKNPLIVPTPHWGTNAVVVVMVEGKVKNDDDEKKNKRTITTYSLGLLLTR